MTNPGYALVGVGLQYGDEGKVKIFDKISGIEDIGMFARFNGGSNAGHTLELGGKRIATHAVPGGIAHPHMQLYVGSGCVLNPIKIVSELHDIKDFGFDLEGRLHIAGAVPLVQPSHMLLDGATGGKVGTTGNGIGPAYADVAYRNLGSNLRNIRLIDYVKDHKESRSHVKKNAQQVAKTYGIDCPIDELVQEFDAAVSAITPFLEENPLYALNQIESGCNIFFEGANAVLLDVLTGTVPFVTSSRTIAQNAFVGGDVPLRYHKKTVGVAKAIMSRVGNGPFVSEFGGNASEAYCAFDGGLKYGKEVEQRLYNPSKMLESCDPLAMAIGLRMLGNEYGATTKRPRRIGALDLVQLKQSARLNGIDELFLTKVDCLSDFNKTRLEGIPVVTAYKLDGKTIDFMPQTSNELRRSKPVVAYLPHIDQAVENGELTPKAKYFVSEVEKYVGIPIKGVGIGPDREDFLWL
ncbi:MAG: adenylosuccinate synthetase [Candidatus Woesearchaeota archaeon]